MKGEKPKDALEEVEEEYERYPRIFIISFLLLVIAFLIVQSYFAEPRELFKLISDSWEILFLFAILIFTFWIRKSISLFVFGLIFLLIPLLMFLGIIDFIKPAYGTLFFLGAVWFIGDWINFKRFKKSLFSELLNGNYYIAAAIIFSTLFIGALTELINIPFKLWSYTWPIPSIKIAGVPVVYIIFGWLPWIIAMFVIFYPLSLKKPKKFRK